ncbi:FAD-dependent oxidoreductase [Corynebacterium glyciniphilum]|uniref:FAD-dependent oxidoreductase n=1 Tax=Corynebacterium glyciniphilum TaxID=1404244 RepID=UPI003DA1AA39
MDDQTWDVIIIGGGGAGLSAAVSATERGASVLLFEAEETLGGSTQLSAGLFTAAGTSVQAELGVEDSPEKFFQHYMDLNRWLLKPGLIRAFCESAGPALEWLISLGVEVPAHESTNAHMPGLCQAGVEDLWRGHVPKGQGYGLVQVLERAARSAGVDIVLNTRVQSLLSDPHGVRGVVIDDEEIHCSAVVIASGGFARDRCLLEKYYPYALRAAESLFVAAGPGSRGDHLSFGEQVGAAVAGEGYGLMLPTAYFQSRHHWEAGFPPRSRIHVNSAGRRFMNEDASYAVSPGLIDRQGGSTWMIFDETARESLPGGYVDWNADNILAEVAAGRLLCADSLAELAEKMTVPAKALEYTVAAWNEELPAGQDPVFLRTDSLAAKGASEPIAPLDTPPYYAARYLPAELVCTHAAPEIDARARVIDRYGRPVPGLFAAGEAGGGVLGSTYVGGGNAVANAITMGRTAGHSAAEHRGSGRGASTESLTEETT